LSGIPLRVLDTLKESGIPDKGLTFCFAKHALFRNDGVKEMSESSSGESRNDGFVVVPAASISFIASILPHAAFLQWYTARARLKGRIRRHF
jgi:hypothetical protein